MNWRENKWLRGQIDAAVMWAWYVAALLFAFGIFRCFGDPLNRAFWVTTALSPPGVLLVVNVALELYWPGE